MQNEDVERSRRINLGEYPEIVIREAVLILTVFGSWRKGGLQEMADFVSAIGNGLKSAFTIYSILLAYGVYLDLYHIKEDKRKLADRLNGVLGDESSLASLFLPLFDRVFDPNKTGRPRFLRSVMASCVAMAILLVLWWFFHRQRADDFINSTFWEIELTIVILFAISINLIGDFFSLWETRFVIGRMATAGNSKRQAIWLITDLVLTVMIYGLGCLLGLLIFFISGIFGDIDPPLSLLVQIFVALFFEGGMTFSHPEEIVFDFFSIFFFTTLITSVWVWVFMLGITLWPLLRRIYRRGNVEHPALLSVVVGGVFIFPIIAVVVAIVRLFFYS